MNGNLIANWTVAEDYWVTYTTSLVVDTTSHDVEIRYTNDAYVDGDDRNLHVDVAVMRS